MSKANDFSYYIQQLCSFCYKEKRYNVFKDDKCERCQNRNINPVYVNARDHLEFVRDFRNSGKIDQGTAVDMCKHADIINKYNHATINKGCSFAVSEFEYFIWNWMKTHRKYKISEIFNEFIFPFVFTLKPYHNYQSLPMVQVLKEHQKIINSVPYSNEENERLQADEKKKIYFCWFCFKNITSEHDIGQHVLGNDHKSYYEADKKRRWYFKMPKYKPVIMCKEEGCSCFSPHKEDEYLEMNARIKYRNFNFKSFDLAVKDITPWPLNIHLIMPKFPNNFECYKVPIRTTNKLILNGFTVSYICLRDDESRPFFTLRDNRSNEKGHILKFELHFKEHFDNFDFDIEFGPLCSGTYMQNLEFGFIIDGKEYCCQKIIRIDVGTPQHLDKLKEIWTKFNPILKRSQNKNLTKYLKTFSMEFKDIKFDNIIPFSISNPSNSSILNEDLLRRIFRIVPNLQWVDTRVEPWNYCDWMRDMLVHEELEQQHLLSQLLYIGDMKVSNSLNKENYIQRFGKLFGTIFFKNECHNTFAREFMVQNINKVFVLFQGRVDASSLYECDLVDKYYYDVESRSVHEVSLCIPETAVKNLQLKDGMVLLNVTIIFRYNRLIFERRHQSLDKMPHYDLLSYTPLCCPSFTRLPYGENQSAVDFKPQLILNPEQEKLPKLVLRRLKNDEIVLPFILNGAFGTGKSSVIAETVRTILNTSVTSRILICTRSYSGGKVYVNIFKNCLTDKMRKKVRIIFAPKKNIENEYIDYWIYNEDLIYEEFAKYRVFITTLDNVTNALSPLLLHFNDNKPMFDYLFVDEAAQILEADAISVYQFGNKNSKFIFAGDVFQVRPEYHNLSLKKFSVPIVCRLHIMYKQCPDYEICLRQVYRAHPKLVDYLSEAIYKNCELKSNVVPLYPNLIPMKFIDSNKNGENREEFDENYYSFKNDLEAKMIVIAIDTLLNDYREKGLSENKILICTPFYSQVKLIRDKLKKKRLSITVELPTGIQGKEFDAVFISTVLTINNEHQYPVPHPTFHSNKNLINLAISRAKHYVEVIGDKQCLLNQQCSYQWEKFIEFCSILN